MCDGPDIFLVLLAILFPPIGVWVKRGICSADSLINLALCCLGYLPGLIHSWYIISAYPDRQHIEQFDDGEGGQSRYAYYVVSGPGGAQGGYGTLNAAPAQGQFPGQQAGGMPGVPVNGSKTAPQQPPVNQAAGPGPSSSSVQQPGEPAPPSYADAVKGDHKVQHD